MPWIYVKFIVTYPCRTNGKLVVSVLLFHFCGDFNAFNYLSVAAKLLKWHT